MSKLDPSYIAALRDHRRLLHYGSDVQPDDLAVVLVDDIDLLDQLYE